MPTDSEHFFAVDRLEGGTAIILADDGDTSEVPMRELPTGTREGSVISARVDERGVPDWASAQLDHAERDRRLKHSREVLDHLRKTDPGGDIVV